MNRSTVSRGLAACFVAVAGLAASASAGVLNVGEITLFRHQTQTNGMEITARFDPNGSFAEQDCCNAADLRWIQVVSTTARAGFSPPGDLRPFIDPRNGQNIGDPLTGDALPFYDVTYTGDPAANPSLGIQRGTGSHIYDAPALNNPASRPNTFCADTLLVCLKPGTMMMAILGGFTWGFDITAGGAVTLKNPSQLGDSADLRAKFNTALGLDFPGWSLISAGEAWPDAGPLIVTTTVPSPAGITVLAMAGIAATRRRRAA